jgi:hypothetical protein
VVAMLPGFLGTHEWPAGEREVEGESSRTQ